MASLDIICQEPVVFSDRRQAAHMLAEHIAGACGKEKPLILGIPRGGMVIAADIAAEVGGDLDIILTRKLGAPNNPELAIGAITETAETVLNDELICYLNVSSAYIENEKTSQKNLIAQRSSRYRGIYPKQPIKDRIVVLTDDGVATGATMRAAIWAAKAESPSKIILAIPVAPPDTAASLSREVDRTICISAPSNFGAVGMFYRDFNQVSDETVIRILENTAKR
ncbi:Putative phosphoribosyl transferase [Limihaloglobus sulfuriphilus]|uniref:Putative phosphoribosyl transferase n=1 Tax=Limihaloglobus sulfuriphilus TaxID=1851148 RepID=A0A1Q2MC52_9BACT|nr:phosphoribosyltransferase family protein [Limihaloglobus sulfuriphilus]AQQ70261.1 Putative phosphoribosyl transferase [Limihaloglobus sulfuriphilus]